jgi:hypothetical protein
VPFCVCLAWSPFRVVVALWDKAGDADGGYGAGHRMLNEGKNNKP